MNPGLSSNFLYVGIDESNHGRFPEIIVAVNSRLESDVIESNTFLPKSKKNSGRLLRVVERNCYRNYTFLFLNQNDLGKIPKNDFYGVITGSLLKEENFDFVDNTKIFIDGEITIPQKLRVKDLVSEICEIERDRLSIKDGGNLDRKYFLVNLADGISRHIFKTYTPEEMSVDPHLRYLVY